MRDLLKGSEEEEAGEDERKDEATAAAGAGTAEEEELLLQKVQVREAASGVSSREKGKGDAQNIRSHVVFLLDMGLMQVATRFVLGTLSEARVEERVMREWIESLVGGYERCGRAREWLLTTLAADAELFREVVVEVSSTPMHTAVGVVGTSQE